MGAYLSEPRTEKISSDEFNDKLVYGASSMQGWRISQEDAHNCIINFDTNTSLFAVYDGHGGREVAVYCSQKLPDFIKQTEAYKKGDLKQALIDAYLGFDATIATKEVVALLKEIAGSAKSEEDKNFVDSEDEENVDNLYEEASMPLDKLMEKYHLHTDSKKPPASPNLQSCEGPSCSSSSKEIIGFSKKTTLDEACGSKIAVSNVKNEVCEKVKNVESECVKNELDVTDSKNNSSSNECEKEKKNTQSEINGDTSQSSILLPVENGQLSSENTVTLKSCKDKSNSDNENNVKNEYENTGSDATGADEGKKLDNKLNVNRSKLKHCTIRQLYSAILSAGDCDDVDSEDENDTTFDGVVEDSDGDQEDSDEDSVSSEENEKEDDIDEESDEDDDEEEDDDFTMNMTEEPGWDSGCTAVVALLHGSELYVANAGDSRCVVCRDGEAIEMSVDHKPETKEECDRISAAGGEVTSDGRVNGGLNLSRAIGDHAYKQATGLPAEQQMITALPDVATLTIDPERDEFMILACDGIWNYMSSEQVIKFIKEKLKCTSIKMSQICEELFDHCLAPNTMGDGTGCDNMTAIIVHFKNSQIGKAKRSSSPSGNENEDRKRIKINDVNIVT